MFMVHFVLVLVKMSQLLTLLFFFAELFGTFWFTYIPCQVPQFLLLYILILHNDAKEIINTAKMW